MPRTTLRPAYGRRLSEHAGAAYAKPFLAGALAFSMAMPVAAIPAFADEASDASQAASADAAASSDSAASTAGRTGADAAPRTGSDIDDADIAAMQLEESFAPKASAPFAVSADGLPPTTALPQDLKELSAIDAQIAALGDPSDVAEKIAAGTLPRQDEILFLQRSLVEDAGYDKLVEFANKSQDHSTFLQWVLSDYETLALYVTGGRPGGNYSEQNMEMAKASHERSLQQFMDIARANEADLQDSTPEADRQVYKRMMISAALGMHSNTRLWVGNNNAYADPVDRYYIIKTFRANAERYRFNKELFDQLPVENMRWVFENRISNEEMPWLANYTISKYPADEGARMNAYNYVEYNTSFGGYGDKEFFDEYNLYTEGISKEPNDYGQPIEGGYAKKYQFSYEDENFPNADEDDTYYYKQYSNPRGEELRLWMPFEKGGVCGALAKTYANLSGISGVPAADAGQPKHAVCLTYSLVEDKTENSDGTKKPFYSLVNNAWSWFETSIPVSVHMPCDWREVHTADPNDSMTTIGKAGSFLLMAQDALNDMDAYTKAWELRELAAAQTDTAAKLAVLDAALGVQPFNCDTIVAKIELYAAKQATQEEWVTLAEQTADACKQYPYPMHSLMVRIEQESNDPMTKAKIETKRIAVLEEATTYTEKDMIQYQACVDTAKSLLGQESSKMFWFSFDGEDAGKIKLGAQFDATQVPWKYSLDGGATWTEVTDGSSSVQLTEEQIGSITAADDLQMQVIGIPDQTHTIDILDGVAPDNYYVNNAANRIYTREGKSIDSIEAKVDGEWVNLGEGVTLPDNVPVELRSAPFDTTLPSYDTETVIFTPEYELPESTFIPYEECSVNSWSSHAFKERPERVLDGYFGPGITWHNTYSRETYPQITIDLGEQRSLSYIDFWRRWEDNNNGIPYNMEVLVAPDTGLPRGEKIPDDAFESAKTLRFDWNQGEGVPKHMRHIQFDEPVDARYVRLYAVSTRTENRELGPDEPRFFSCSQLDFFETERKPEPEPEPEPQPEPPVQDSYEVTAGESANGTISFDAAHAQQGDTVRVSAAPKLGYRLVSLLVEAADGTTIAPTLSSEGFWEFSMPGCAVTVHADFAPAYNDVDPQAWYAPAAFWAYAEHVMTGVAEGVFASEDAVTRGMLATTLYRLAGEPDAAPAGFDDVDASAYYADAIDWAAATGVATGYGDERVHFGPEDAMTREQLAVMLFRYAGNAGADTSARADLAAFSDAESVTPYAREALSWAVAEGLVRGIADADVLAPVDGATRAQVATVLMRFDEMVGA